MTGLINRFKYWLKVRKYHIESIHFETNRNGHVDVLVQVDGELHKITDIRHLEGLGESITDYGIYCQVNRAT